MFQLQGELSARGWFRRSKHVSGVSGGSGVCPPAAVEDCLPPGPRCGPCGPWGLGSGLGSGSDPAAQQQRQSRSPELHRGPGPGGTVRVSGLHR